MAAVKSDSKSYSLNMRVHVVVCSKLKPHQPRAGDIFGFVLPNGDIIRPIFAVEVDHKDDKGDDQYEDVTRESDLHKLGITFVEYGDHTFEEEE